MIVIKAVVRPDEDQSREFTGYSQEVVGDGMINQKSALENAETSAVGRALAMMGIGVIDSVASVDEIRKATRPSYPVTKRAYTTPKPVVTGDQEAQFVPEDVGNKEIVVDEFEDAPMPDEPPFESEPRPRRKDQVESPKCFECNAEVDEAVADYSKRFFGMYLCRTHQKDEKYLRLKKNGNS